MSELSERLEVYTDLVVGLGFALTRKAPRSDAQIRSLLTPRLGDGEFDEYIDWFRWTDSWTPTKRRNIFSGTKPFTIEGSFEFRDGFDDVFRETWYNDDSVEEVYSPDGLRWMPLAAEELSLLKHPGPLPPDNSGGCLDACPDWTVHTRVAETVWRRITAKGYDAEPGEAGIRLVDWVNLHIEAVERGDLSVAELGYVTGGTGWGEFDAARSEDY